MNEQVTGSAALQGKEISKLAREYAEELYPEEYELSQEDENSPAYNSEAVDLIEQCEADFICHLRFILRDHCIVKKSEVIEKYRHAKKMQNSKSAPSSCAGSCVAATLEDFFGTDLFKERSEK